MAQSRNWGVLSSFVSIAFLACSAVPHLRDLPMLFIDYRGLKYLAKIQDCWRFTRPFEPLTSEFLVGNAEENDVFLDIGAHVGIHAIRLAQEVSKVIALEPEPENYSLLYRNIFINNLSGKFIVLPIAISDRDGYAYLCLKTSSGAHTLEDSVNCRKRVKIITLRIDTLLKVLKVSKVDIVKIDVEGHENKVVNGMERLLNYNPPRILVIETKKDNTNLRESLIEKGYRVQVLDCWNSMCNYGFYMAK